MSWFVRYKTQQDNKGREGKAGGLGVKTNAPLPFLLQTAADLSSLREMTMLPRCWPTATANTIPEHSHNPPHRGLKAGLNLWQGSALATIVKARRKGLRERLPGRRVVVPNRPEHQLLFPYKLSNNYEACFYFSCPILHCFCEQSEKE